MGTGGQLLDITDRMLDGRYLKSPDDKILIGISEYRDKLFLDNV